MWDYSDKVKDHFRNPKNVGYIKNPDGIGEVGSLACGDALRLMFKLDENKRIVDVKFQTFGCGSAIASSSALTEMIKGLTIEEAEKITNKDIAQYLGGLPEQKMHCSVMGREALEVAIENYRTGKTGAKKLDGNVTCICFGVLEKDIERAVRENHLTTIEEITNYTKAGGGCGGCHEALMEIITRVTGQPTPQELPQIDQPKKRLTNIQKIQMIQETIDREIRPVLRKDGGDIELIDVDSNNVIVSMRGTCSQCRVASFTLRDVVQAKLREFVSEELIVVEE
ncbi:MAG: Fe-S cluster assembly protein NifU [Pseudomonadota bacterium]